MVDLVKLEASQGLLFSLLFLEPLRRYFALFFAFVCFCLNWKVQTPPRIQILLLLLAPLFQLWILRADACY